MTEQKQEVKEEKSPILSKEDVKIEEKELVEKKDPVEKSPEVKPKELPKNPIIDHFKCTIESYAFIVFFAVFEIVIIGLYFALCKNGQDGAIIEKHGFSYAVQYNRTLAHPLDEDFDVYYKVFIDVAIMIIVGFGYLMAFYKRHGYYAVALVFVLTIMSAQLSMIIMGYLDMCLKAIKGTEIFDFWIKIGLELMIRGLYCGAAVMISMGGVIGKFTPFQIILMCFLEVPLYCINSFIIEGLLGILDVGGSVVIHTFGAYFGLCCSWTSTQWIIHKEKGTFTNDGTSYNGDLFSMLGTTLLWIFWPSFNAAMDLDYRHRIVTNTYLSLTGAVMITFLFSRIYRKKFGMVDLQNATLAGGVAIGCTANYFMPPGCAILIGAFAGFISTTGFNFYQPFLYKYLKLHDSCGIHNLHAMPGVLGGVVSIFISIPMKTSAIGDTLQPIIQLYCLCICLAIACSWGAIVGLILRFVCPPKNKNDYWNDEAYFVFEGEEEEKPKNE